MRSSGLSNLTIIIPTISRPQFVLRQFEYWRVSDAQIVILDGAQHPIEIPENLRSPNIRYVCVGTRFNERLASAGAYVSTAYCALLPDDEFYLFSGLHAAIARLEADRDLIGCVGRCLGFFIDQGRFLTRDMYRDWKPFSPRAVSLHQRLEEDLPPNKTHGASYAIMPAHRWNAIFEKSYRQWFSSGYVYERLTNLQRTLAGRTVILEDLLWMRSLENPPIYGADVPRVGGRDFVSWARNPEFADEVRQYRAIALDLFVSGGVARPAAVEFEERFFIGGVHRQATKELRSSKKLSTLVRHIALNHTPQSLRTAAKRFAPNKMLAFSGWQGFELAKMCASLEERGTRFDRENLEFVKELSLKLNALDRKARNPTT